MEPTQTRLTATDMVPDRPWTTDSFLAWEDRREGKYEFDGKVIPTTGGSVEHQILVVNLVVVPGRLLAGRSFVSSLETRLRIVVVATPTRGPAGVRIAVNGCGCDTFRNGNLTRRDSYWKIVEGRSRAAGAHRKRWGINPVIPTMIR